MIECVDGVTIEEVREIRDRQDIDQESERPRRARKTPHRLLTILYIMISKGGTLVL